MIDFDTYFQDIFEKDKNCPLFHEWAYDQMFHEEQLSPAVAKKIKQALYKTLSAGFWTSGHTKVIYGQELTGRVRIPAGIYKGTKIRDLPPDPDIWTLLIQLKQTTKDEHIRQACIAKLNEMQIKRDMAKDFANKKSKNKNRF